MRPDLPFGLVLGFLSLTGSRPGVLGPKRSLARKAFDSSDGNGSCLADHMENDMRSKKAPLSLLTVLIFSYTSIGLSNVCLEIPVIEVESKWIRGM